jgi:S1-C subfamily serine protease
MRVWAAAGLAVVTAALGAGAALLVAGTIGLGEETTTVVVDAVPATGATTPSPVAPIRAGRFDPQALYASRADGVVTVYAAFGQQGRSQGSGFVVDDAGVILTNAHVITNVEESSADDLQRANAVYVEFTDGERVKAELVGWDLYSDVGVLRVSPADHPVAPVPLGASATVRVGQPVAAIGSPFGQQGSLSVGVVSAIGRSIDSLTGTFQVANAIQIDAPINRGNSGGPLFDATGRVIGINAQIRSQSGTAEGVGFAIPIDLAKRSLDQLLRTGKVRYAYIGVSTQDVTPGIAQAFDLTARRGALITRVEGGTPAAAAGLRGGSRTEAYNGLDVTLGGDVIVAIAGSPVRDADDVSRLVTTRLEPGQTVPFTVLRAGRRMTVDVRLGDRPDGSG